MQQCEDPCFENSAYVQSLAIEAPSQFVGVDLVQTQPVKLVNGIFRTAGVARTPRDMGHDDCTPLWWTVEFWAHELETTETVAGVRARLPSESEILADGRHGTAGCKARIFTEGDVVDVDVRQGMRLSLLTSHISVQVQCGNDPTLPGVTSTAAQIRDSQPDDPSNAGILMPTAGAPFFVWSTLLRAQLRPALAPIGQRVATCTRTYVSDGTAAQRLIPIPARARRVTLYPNAATPLLPAPVTFVSHSGTLFSRGFINFNPPIRSRNHIDVPGNATCLDLGPTARATTAIWELEW